jgi:hypothetical protein
VSGRCAVHVDSVQALCCIGYRSVALSDLKNARLLSRALEASGYYTVLSDIHRLKSEGSVGSAKQALDEEHVEVRLYSCAPPAEC